MSSITNGTNRTKGTWPAAKARGQDRPDPNVIVARKIGRESLPVRTRLLAGVIARLYDEQLRAVGLTATQFEILAFVGARGRTTAKEVAGILHLDGPTAGRTIQGMVDTRWLTSGPDSGGMTELAWTSKGRRVFEQALPAWKRAQYAATDLLGHEGTSVLTSHGVYTALW